MKDVLATFLGEDQNKKPTSITVIICFFFFPLEMDPKQYYPEFLKVALSRQPCERLIVSPRRQILIEGPLLMFDSGKPIEMFVILFDDLLVVTRKKKALHKKVSIVIKTVQEVLDISAGQ